MPELARSYEPAGAATKDDRAPASTHGPAGGRWSHGRTLIHRLDGVGESRLVEFVLREDHLAVGAHEHAPRNPAVRQRTEELPLAIGDHGELEVELLLPGATGLLGLERPEIDDLEPFAREPLMESHDGRTLLPTALSGRLPEDQEHPAPSVDRQPQISHRQGAPGLDPSGQAVNDLHLPPSVLTGCHANRIGTEAGADQIEGGDAALVERAEQVLFDDLPGVPGPLHPKPIEDMQSIADVGARGDQHGAQISS
jgi:hypothetical protein